MDPAAHLPNSSSGASPFFRSHPVLCLYHSCVGVIGCMFVCASWGLRATDRVIFVVAGPDDTGSIAPTPDSARSGLCSKWTSGALCAHPSNGSLRPGGWAEGGSPYGSTYSGVSSYAGSPAGPPILPYSPYSPSTVPPPLSDHTQSGGAGGFPGTPTGLGLSPGLFAPGLPGGTGGSGLRTLATAATPRSPLSGIGSLLTPRDTARKDD
jgi:hypothetical protein